MRLPLRIALGAFVAAVTAVLAGLAFGFIHEAAKLRGDDYLVGIAYFASAWIATCGLAVIASLFAPSEGA